MHVNRQQKQPGLTQSRRSRSTGSHSPPDPPHPPCTPGVLEGEAPPRKILPPQRPSLVEASVPLLGAQAQPHAQENPDKSSG